MTNHPRKTYAQLARSGMLFICSKIGITPTKGSFLLWYQRLCLIQPYISRSVSHMLTWECSKNDSSFSETARQHIFGSSNQVPFRSINFFLIHPLRYFHQTPYHSPASRGLKWIFAFLQDKDVVVIVHWGAIDTIFYFSRRLKPSATVRQDRMEVKESMERVLVFEGGCRSLIFVCVSGFIAWGGCLLILRL